MRDQIRSNATVLRAELGLWLTIIALCFVFLIVLASCKGPDAGERVLSTFTVAYTDGSGSSTHGGTIDNPGYMADPSYSGSSDSDFHAWTFSISPLAAMHDPQARTRESLDAMLADMRARDDAERAARLPFVESAPVTGAVTSGAALASRSEPEGSVTAPASTGLKWWQDTALITGYATILAVVIAGAIKGWSMIPKKASA